MKCPECGVNMHPKVDSQILIYPPPPIQMYWKCPKCGHIQSSTPKGEKMVKIISFKGWEKFEPIESEAHYDEDKDRWIGLTADDGGCPSCWLCGDITETMIRFLEIDDGCLNEFFCSNCIKKLAVLLGYKIDDRIYDLGKKIILLEAKIGTIQEYNEELKKHDPNSFRVLKHITQELDMILDASRRSIKNQSSARSTNR